MLVNLPDRQRSIIREFLDGRYPRAASALAVIDTPALSRARQVLAADALGMGAGLLRGRAHRERAKGRADRAADLEAEAAELDAIGKIIGGES